MRALAAVLALAAASAAAQEAAPATPPGAAPAAQPAPPPPPAPPASPQAATAQAPEQRPPPSPPPSYAPPPPGYAPPPPGYAPPPPGYAPPPPGYAPPRPPPGQPPAYARPGARRDPWYIGFGIGTGSARFVAADGTRVSFTDWAGADPFTLSLNFKVGATLSPDLLLGFDVTAVRTQSIYRDSFGGESTVGIQVNNYDAMLTWFPMGEGFFLRGGAGFASLVADTTGAVGTARGSQGGVGVVAGLGYAFWLGRSFNLTLNLDLSGQSYGKSDSDPFQPKSSSAVNFFVGFDWY